MSSPLHTVDRLTLGLGHFLADFFAPASTLPNQHAAVGTPPFAVWADGIAGRSRIGTDLAALSRPGVVASVVVFSWPALRFVLHNVGERWAMIPTKNPELVRVEVRQELEAARLAEPWAQWLALMIFGGLLTLALSAAGIASGVASANPIVLVAFMIVFVGVTWIAANLLLLGSVRRIGERLYRTSVTLEYGYPEKTRLLVALSDAPIAEQRQAATKLLQTLAERGASQWDYLDAQGGRGLGLSFGGGGSQLSALLRRLVRPAIGLAIVWALFSFGRALVPSVERRSSLFDISSDSTAPDWLRGEWVRQRTERDSWDQSCQIEDRMTVTGQSLLVAPSRHLSGRGYSGDCEVEAGAGRSRPLLAGTLSGGVYSWSFNEYDSPCRFESAGSSLIVSSCGDLDGRWEPAP